MSFQFVGNPSSSWTGGGYSRAEEMAARAEGRTAGPVGSVHTSIMNETGLPDAMVERAVMQYMETEVFAENASLAGAQSTFQTYVNDGSLLAKHRYRTPTNVIEEMKLARDLAERDDDVRAVIGGLTALAFQHINYHARDRRTQEIVHHLAGAKHMKLKHVLQEMYREYLITSTVTTVKLLTPMQIMVPSEGSTDNFDKPPTLSPLVMLTPQIGILPGENIRVIGSDLFGDKALAYWPGDDMKLTKFLEEYFSDQTSAARKRQMQLEDPVSTRLFIAPVAVQEQQSFIPGSTFTAYLMNPSMVHRTTMGKGFWPYPRPLLASVFPLLEAKRLLNIMDFALLQGTANYIVVAKKGTDQRPALPNEIVALRELVRHLGRTGVVVGDHRLSFEILTPEMEGMLSADRRELIARRIVGALCRKPISTQVDAGAEGASAEIEWISRVMESDRADLIEHIESDVLSELIKANPDVLKAHPKIWCPKIILQGTQYFTDLVLKLRDRGDIPRKWSVEAAGFDFEAAIAERQWEKDAGIDDILEPAAVPYTVPSGVPDKGAGTDPFLKSGGSAPSDNEGGRPTGAKTGTKRDPRAPNRAARGSGETVKAWREAGGRTYRMGETTRELIQHFAETAKDGRLSRLEQRALQGEEVPGVTVIGVTDEDVAELHVLRLNGEMQSALIGRNRRGAVVTRALLFRDIDPLEAQETAMAWGFDLGQGDESDAA